jgi:hypothetical protein
MLYLAHGCGKRIKTKLIGGSGGCRQCAAGKNVRGTELYIIGGNME